VVTETFFAKERGQKMGIWTLMVTLGQELLSVQFLHDAC
jgi:hypothetical protein